ncbi:site-specific DNA-methyltransferase [Staphylococcus haemolyticus]|uniref:site-specific DNA-methyltransferase n=1 Tax=Staphylococcus haemolyticus TaxID=1283 RepID=UPI0034D63093
MSSEFIERPFKNEKDEAIKYISNLLNKAKNKNELYDAQNLEEVLRLLNSKKYGLVWEEHKEKVEEKLKTHIPVFKEDKERKINGMKNINDFNFLLEGDNLHSLYLLEKTHTNKIDLIYIDPPYNMGQKDFKYNDAYVDKDDNYYHSKWLSFMKSRLLMAKKLLTEDGILAVSIDYHEGFQLKLLLDEIFGENNFASDLHVETSAIAGPRRIAAMKGSIVKTTEYVLIYTKNSSKKVIKKPMYDKIEGFDSHYSKFLNSESGILENFTETLRRTKNISDIFEKYNMKINLENLGKLVYLEKEVSDWLYDKSISANLFRIDTIFKDKSINLEKGLNIVNGKYVVFNTNGKPYYAFRYSERIGDTSGFIESFGERAVRGNLWKGFSSDGGNLKKEGSVDFKKGKKPLRLIKQLVMTLLGDKQDTIILDFFAGSGTTAHAVAALNKEDGGNRKYIICTNNENNICEEVTYKRLENIQSDLPHNVKYFKTCFIEKELFPDIELESELLKYITPLVELEFTTDIKNPLYQIILSNEQLESLLESNNIKSNSVLFMHPEVLLGREEKKMIKSLDVRIEEIPDYFFGKELWAND